MEWAGRIYVVMNARCPVRSCLLIMYILEATGELYLSHGCQTVVVLPCCLCLGGYVLLLMPSFESNRLVSGEKCFL